MIKLTASFFNACARTGFGMCLSEVFVKDALENGLPQLKDQIRTAVESAIRERPEITDDDCAISVEVVKLADLGHPVYFSDSDVAYRKRVTFVCVYGQTSSMDSLANLLVEESMPVIREAMGAGK
jgi:hypothetical protein